MTIFLLYNNITNTINVTRGRKYFSAHQTHFHTKLLNSAGQIKLLKLIDHGLKVETPPPPWVFL